MQTSMKGGFLKSVLSSSLPTLPGNLDPFVVIPCLKLTAQTHGPRLCGAWIRTATPEVIFQVSGRSFNSSA